MARQIIKDHDFSVEGDIDITDRSMLNSRNLVIKFKGTGLDADDAVMSVFYDIEGDIGTIPLKDNEGNNVDIVLATTGGEVTAIVNVEIFPSEILRVVVTRNSVTTGTGQIILGGRHSLDT